MSEKRKAAGKLQDKLAVARGSKLKAEQGGGAGGWVRRAGLEALGAGADERAGKGGEARGGEGERERGRGTAAYHRFYWGMCAWRRD